MHRKRRFLCSASKITLETTGDAVGMGNAASSQVRVPPYKAALENGSILMQMLESRSRLPKADTVNP